MKFKPVLPVLFLLIVHFADAQTVADNFNVDYYAENFDSANTGWTIIANNENLFIIQDGEFILNRKTTISPFAVLCPKQLNLDAYKITACLQLDKSVASNGSIGLYFALQENNVSGFLFEYNLKKECRIRKMVNNEYTNISGSDKDDGWVRTGYLADAKAKTKIEVRCSGADYDLFLNDNYLTSISDKELQKGNCGISIAAGTKGRVDYIKVATIDKYAVPEEQKISVETHIKTADADILTYTDAIIQLKTKTNQLTEENNLLKRTVDAMKNDAQQKSEESAVMASKLQSHDAEMSAIQHLNDSLLNQNKELMKYKELVAGNENSDLIITLSKALKLKTEENETLRKQIKLQNDSIENQNIQIKIINQKLASQPKPVKTYNPKPPALTTTPPTTTPVSAPKTVQQTVAPKPKTDK